MKKNIISITEESIGGDNGSATAIRINFIHRGLEENDYDVEVFSYATSRDVENDNYLFKNLNNSSFVKRFFYFFLINPISFFFFLMKIDKKSLILIDKLAFNLVIPFCLFKLLKGNKIIAIYNEFFVKNADAGSLKSTLKSKMNYFFWAVLLKFTDILIVISDKHSEYFKKYLRKKAKTIVIPMLLDYKKEQISKNKSDVFSICYAGALSKSNGVELLMEQVALIASKVKVRLNIFGPTLQVYRTSLQKKIENLGLTDIVFLDLPKSNEETKSFLKTQDLLVIPKLNDVRAVGYIPSKLGDFLCSGTPVLVANIGEISKHITDKQNGYLFNPDIENDLSNKILEIINNPNDNIGEKGHLYAEKFHYLNQVKELVSVL